MKPGEKLRWLLRADLFLVCHDKQHACTCVLARRKTDGRNVDIWLVRPDGNVMLTNRKRDATDYFESTAEQLTDIKRRTISLTCRRSWRQQRRSALAKYSKFMMSLRWAKTESLTHAWRPMERCSVAAALCLALHHISCLHTFERLFSNTWMAVGKRKKELTIQCVLFVCFYMSEY